MEVAFLTRLRKLMLVVTWNFCQVCLASLCGSHTSVGGLTPMSSNLILESCRVSSTMFLKSKFKGRRYKPDSKNFKCLRRLPHNSKVRHCIFDSVTSLLEDLCYLLRRDTCAHAVGYYIGEIVLSPVSWISHRTLMLKEEKAWFQTEEGFVFWKEILQV